MAKNLELGSIHSCDPVVQKEALVTNIVACMTKETPINKLIEYYMEWAKESSSLDAEMNGTPFTDKAEDKKRIVLTWIMTRESHWKTRCDFWKGNLHK